MTKKILRWACGDAEAAQVADEILEAVHRRLVGRDVYVGTGSLTLAEITQRLGL